MTTYQVDFYNGSKAYGIEVSSDCFFIKAKNFDDTINVLAEREIPEGERRAEVERKKDTSGTELKITYPEYSTCYWIVRRKSS